MKGPIIYILFLVLCCSCGTAKHTTDYQRDSVVVTVRDSVILRDTVIQAAIPAEADRVILPDTDTSRLSTSLAESEAYVKNGRLHHSLRNKSEKLQPVRVQYKDKAHSESVTSIGKHQITETVEVPAPLNWWQRLRITLGDAVLIAAAAWAVWTLVKLLRPL